MGIMLGNLSVNQIEKRTGINFTESERELLNNMRQEKAEDIASDKWHCFDMPFTLLCGSYDTAKKVFDIMSPYSKEMTQQLTIAINEK